MHRTDSPVAALPSAALHATVTAQRRCARRWLALLLCVQMVPAWAQVQRCTAADGSVVFTDRSCESVGAEDWRQPQAGDATASAPVSAGMHTCPRSARDIAAQVSAAIQANDSNQLSALYDWVGVASTQQAAVFAQLDALARRPLAGLEPILAAPTAAATPANDASANDAPAAARDAPAAPPRQQVTTAAGTVTWAPAAPVPAGTTATSDDDARPANSTPRRATDTTPRAPPPPRVVGIRVLQSAPDGIRAINTPLQLVRRWGCWWLRF